MQPKFRRTNTPPPSAVDAPSVEPSVLRALKRVDPTFHLQFSHYIISGLDGLPIVFEKTGEPMLRPRWHLWVRGDRGVYFRVLTVQDENGGYLAPDHRLVHQVETDSVRLLGVKETLRREQERLEQEKEQKIKEEKAKDADFASANYRQLKEALSDPLGKPQLKEKSGAIVSYAGQSNRSRTQDTLEHPFSIWENPWLNNRGE